MKPFFILMLVLFGHSLFAQTPDYDNIKLGNKEVCTAAEPAAIQACTYMLSTPYEKNDLARLKSLSFIIKWMSATPDFSFTIDETATKSMKGNDDLIGLYLAAMTKYSLENREAAKDKNKVKLNAVTLVLNYCEDEKNKMKMPKALKKLSEAKAKGELEKALE